MTETQISGPRARAAAAPSRRALIGWGGAGLALGAAAAGGAVVVARAGHAVPQRRPTVLAQLVQEFLAAA